MEFVTFGAVDVPELELDTRADGYIKNITTESEATFKPEDIVDLESSNGAKNLGAQNACLVRYKKGDTYRHTVEGKEKHDSNVNLLCGYLVKILIDRGNCKSPYLSSWNKSLMGCVHEPPLPGPDVFNSVRPVGLSPSVDYSFCLDNLGTGPEGCNKNKGDSLIKRGSTFDRPIIVLSGGGEGGNLDLQYSFKGDNEPDGKFKICDRFNVQDGFRSDFYCAHVPKDNPNKVCACLKRRDGKTEDEDGYINHCGDNQYIGCTDRPTLEHSNLKLLSEFKVYIDESTGRKFPSVSPVFARTNQKNEVLYIDQNNDDVCLNVADGLHYKCDNDGNPTSTRAVGELKIKERLKLPLSDADGIREYYIDFPNKNYTCKDAADDIVRIDEDGKFYKMEGDQLTTIPAEEKPRCANFVLPRGYVKDEISVYGVKFSSAIAQDEAGFVRFGRYTSDKDELQTNRVCTPLKMTTICDTRGTTNFYADGSRDNFFCRFPNLDGCERYAKGDHDEEAKNLFCSGAYLGPISQDEPANICLVPSNQWYFQTKEDYKNTVDVAGSLSKFTLDCDRKIPIDTMCSPIELGCRRVDVPTMASGFSKWPDMEKGQTVNGFCDEELGYTNYIWTAPYTPDFTKTKEEVCAKKEDPMISCDQFYDEYLSDGNSVREQFKIAEELAYNEYRKFSELSSILSPFYSRYIRNDNGNIVWYVANRTPKKTCNQGGTATITNHCIRK